MPDFGFSAASLQSSDKFAPYSKVILKTDDYDNSQVKTFTAGDDSGRTLEAVLPWASQNAANSILESIRGYAYQPITAKGVIVDPATELGDDITVGGVSGYIENQDITFGGILRADIAAPGEEQIDHEYQFIVKRDRKTARNFGAVGAAIRDTNKQLLAIDNGLAQITDYNEETGYALSQAAIYASILDKETGGFEQAVISASVVYDKNSGKFRSLADILADQITLQGNTEVIGNLKVNEGVLNVDLGLFCDGNIVGDNLSLQDGGQVLCHHVQLQDGGYICIAGNNYTPKEITSTTGAVMALGYT